MQNNNGQINSTDKLVFSRLQGQTGVDHEAYQRALDEAHTNQAQLWPYWLQKNNISAKQYLVTLNEILALDIVDLEVTNKITHLAKTEIGRLCIKNNLILLQQQDKYLIVVGCTGSDLEWLAEWNAYQNYEITYQLTEIKLFLQAINIIKLKNTVTKYNNISELVTIILHYAIAHNCSDIHGEITATHLQLRFRIHGILTEKITLNKNLSNQIINRLKILSQCDVAQTRLPQDGYLAIEGYASGPQDARINFCPTIHGEKWVIRLLPQNVILSLGQLGFNDTDYKKIEKSIKQPQGLILITGPTGSGKTTTLYSFLQHINDHTKNITTIEDPVEKQLTNVNQIQTNKTIGLDFATGLRAILRQDPDIIMIGEIRDYETAEIALKAAQTGHLVFATLHSNSTAHTISRLLAMGFHPNLLSQTITTIIAQRLVRAHNKQQTKRLALYECMFNNKELKHIIENVPFKADLLTAKACSQGMQTLQQLAKDLTDKKIINQEEANRVINYE